MTILLLLGAAVMILNQDAGGVASEAQQESSCAASLEEVRTIILSGKDNLIFTTWKGEGSAHIDAKGNYSWSPTEYARDRQLSIPSPASIGEMSDGSDLSAVESCPTIRQFLKDNHVKYGDKAVDAAMKRRDPDVIFASLSLAKVDRGGDHALIAEGFSGTMFGGGGWLNLMARDKKGSWHRTHSAPTWIS